MFEVYLMISFCFIFVVTVGGIFIKSVKNKTRYKRAQENGEPFEMSEDDYFTTTTKHSDGTKTVKKEPYLSLKIHVTLILSLVIVMTILCIQIVQVSDKDNYVTETITVAYKNTASVNHHIEYGLGSTTVYMIYKESVDGSNDEFNVSEKVYDEIEEGKTYKIKYYAPKYNILEYELLEQSLKW